MDTTDKHISPEGRDILPKTPPEEEKKAVVYDIDDILAQYGRKAREAREAAQRETGEADPGDPASEETLTEKAPEETSEEAPEEPAGEEAEDLEKSGLQVEDTKDEVSPTELFDLPPEEDDENIALSMEEVVASTVDAVQGEQAVKLEALRQRMVKAKKKKEDRSGIRRHMAKPLVDVDEEPDPAKTASFHKSRYYDCRRSLILAVPVLVLLWLPWILGHFGVSVPFFSDSPQNAAICVLVPQLVLMCLCGPLIREAVQGLKAKTCTMYCLVLLADLVTILDEIALQFLPERSEATPLGGVAAFATVFCLWGLKSFHRGLWETFKVAAMGEPAFVADCCLQGAAKGNGILWGFHARVAVPDTAAKLQRILVPVLMAGSLVFAVLSSVGQDRPQDLLLNWSAVLCAGASLVFPLAFAVPFGRLAVRLARSGAAVAGQYGATALSAARRIVVTDNDLFPKGTVALNGLKLYGEERDHALSYAATLAVEAGGCLGRCFEAICRADRIAYQPLEHFHIHDENGLSGMIHGETVLVGSPVFMRHMAVRLPAAMPTKTAVCLAIDGELQAIFSVKYDTSELVEGSVRALSRNGLQLALAVRDGSITPKLLKTRFGSDGGAVTLEREERLALSDPEREVDAPNGILYRDGLTPFVELVAGSRRLCHVTRVGNILSGIGSIFGALVAYYLALSGSYWVLTPTLVLTYGLLWALPILPLLWGVDKT